MKTVAYDGMAAVTTDEVADALMELALAVAQFGTCEAATIPVVVLGQIEQLTLMPGPTIHLSALTVSAGTSLDVAGSGEVAARLRDRAAVVTDPLRSVHLRVEPEQ